jgi:hypothetical protein
MADRLREKVNVPMKHFKSMFEADGQEYNSQLPEGYRLHGNTVSHFNAYISENTYQMHQWHEMDSVVHYQFGTVDNPVLIFTSDSSWRVVICMGPGVEDDSHAHEKMYYYVREGVMHRCHVCGQCFKLVRLKEEDSELNDYYTMMFSQIAHFEVSEEDMAVNLTAPFGDRPQSSFQTLPAQNSYVLVNNDDYDRLMVDPAYRLEKYTKSVNAVKRLSAVEARVAEQMASQSVEPKIAYDKEMYQTWFNVEKSIRKMDRMFNKVEKFEGRKFTDPDNFKRREARMISRKRDREHTNFTYFFGGLTEEEQMYRDYYQTDIEQDPESDVIEAMQDEDEILASGDFNLNRFDFIEGGDSIEYHENFEDVVEDKIFKFKYRKATDFGELYTQRQSRMMERFMERAMTRDSKISTGVHELMQKADVHSSLGAIMLGENPHTQDLSEVETRNLREYMLAEAVQQYKDYYEDDKEEQEFFQYLNELSNHDQIRFMEIFQDFTVIKADNKHAAKIPKREFNPELSLMGNVALDLVDFKDRIKPMARDLALQDASTHYQRLNNQEVRALHEKIQS